MRIFSTIQSLGISCLPPCPCCTVGVFMRMGWVLVCFAAPDLISMLLISIAGRSDTKDNERSRPWTTPTISPWSWPVILTLMRKCDNFIRNVDLWLHNNYDTQMYSWLRIFKIILFLAKFFAKQYAWIQHSLKLCQFFTQILQENLEIMQDYCCDLRSTRACIFAWAHCACATLHHFRIFHPLVWPSSFSFLPPSVLEFSISFFQFWMSNAGP